MQLPSEAHGARVLAVDDRPANLLVLEALLEPLGCDVVRATSGQDALAAIRERGPFAVALLDVFMPGMDGLSTARAIRADDKGRLTPIVLITGDDASRERIAEAYDAGVADFLTKPVDPVMLRAKVSVFVELFRRGEQVRREARQRSRVERERDLLRALDEEREELLTQAEVANRIKDDLLALVSHELRAPVNAILGWSRLIADDALDEEGRRRALSIIERNARLQSKLIEDLLDASRAATGKLQIDRVTTDLTAVVRAAVDTVRPDAEARSITLHETVARVPPLVADPDRLQQVVMNLLTNAVKFTPQDGHVYVTLAASKGRAVIEVRDTGRGITRELLPHVFERFWQADGGPTRRSGGLGLGLSIVRSIVEAHGGTVRAHSDGEGHGATFVVDLPIDEITSEGPQESDPAVAELGAGDRLEDVRVLVVDDEPDARELLAVVLGARGARVATASNAAHALAALLADPPDVLVSDIAMPVIDGHELVRRIRALDNPRASAIPAVAVTAYDRDEDRRRARAAGFQGHVAKPIDPAKLVAVVASMARARRRALAE